MEEVAATFNSTDGSGLPALLDHAPIHEAFQTDRAHLLIEPLVVVGVIIGGIEYVKHLLEVDSVLLLLYLKIIEKLLIEIEKHHPDCADYGDTKTPHLDHIEEEVIDGDTEKHDADPVHEERGFRAYDHNHQLKHKSHSICNQLS